TRHAPLPKDAAEPALARLERLRNAQGSRPTAEIRLEMQKTMQRDAAVFRTQQSLEEGAASSRGPTSRSRTCASPTARWCGIPI
ncbi:protein containing Fumarate reductase/succinate dehydrogenase flavoprotein, partial [mine drainage metagenome]